MYVSDKDKKFFFNIQHELLRNIRQQIVDYLTVENIDAYDEDDDIYNESVKEDIIWSDPISLEAYVEDQVPEITVQQFGIRYKRIIVVKFIKQYLEDMNVDVEIGQFIRWNSNLYQILQETGSEVQIWGDPESQLYKRFICVVK